MAVKPSNARGTRDFSPEVVLRRRRIFDVLRAAFERFGYQPIETPAIENLSTLEGKYGEEGDRLLFRILNSGDYLKDADLAGIQALPDDVRSQKLIPAITEKALRYDLTVPFARYVVQHFNEITLPFKRYQMQPVWRADRPQKGRYREFTQCDADVVGSTSLLHEVEFIQLYDQVLSTLGFRDFTIKINHRKILTAIAEVVGVPDKIVDFTVAVDKLDKIGREGVEKELAERGFTPEQLALAAPVFELRGEPEALIQQLMDWLGGSEAGVNGVADLQDVLSLVQAGGLQRAKLEIDITLARGLNYYTGCIFEVKTNEVEMGSIGGGGRYDDLTGLFGQKGISGAGISFGLDRIYDVMEQLGLFQGVATNAVTVLVANLGLVHQWHYLVAVGALRKAGLAAEIFPEDKKLSKQLEYANKKAIPYVLLLGEKELMERTWLIKDMRTGAQLSFPEPENLTLGGWHLMLANFPLG